MPPSSSCCGWSNDISVYERLAKIETTVAEASDPFGPFGGPETPASTNPPVDGDTDIFAERDAEKLRPLDAKLQERVLTSIGEVLPNEAASHQRLQAMLGGPGA